jgi:hypothetical protein
MLNGTAVPKHGNARLDHSGCDFNLGRASVDGLSVVHRHRIYDKIDLLQ